ncbi:MAG TPA: DUF3021 family protein [Bacillota bacterium]|nr:DUF3021 family protein [Bacillota bacterium]
MKITVFFKLLIRVFLMGFTGAMLSITVFLTAFSVKQVPTTLLWQATLLALLSALVSLIYYSNREFSKQELFQRKMIHFPCTLGVWLGGAYHFRWFSFTNFKYVTFFIVELVLVYLLIMISFCFISHSQAKRLNQKLTEYQTKRSGDLDECH